MTDVTLASGSWRRFARGPWLTRDYEMNALRMQYLPPGHGLDDPLVSPLNVDPAGLAPALGINAEFDGYRDEGQAYAARLEAAGVPVVAKVYSGQIHDFFLMGGELEAALRRLLAHALARFVDGLGPRPLGRPSAGRGSLGRP